MNINIQTRKILASLALIGLLDSVYLTVLKLTNNQSMCLKGIGDCWSVNISRFSELGGIPIAILGAGAYLTILTLLFYEHRLAFLDEYGNLILFGITLIGVMYSAYLTYVEVAILNAICPFCVLSAVVMVALFGLTIYRMIKRNQAA